MITPETKSWTWVLERPCPECGFDASTCDPAQIPALLRANAADWRRLLDEGLIAPGRPDEDTWSSLEYACHVRDVFRIYDTRLARMLEEDDPELANWDQDASADEERYDEQDPSAVVADIETGAEAVARRLEGVAGDEWDRPGRRSDGAAFTVDTISRYLIHDPIHHVWDVRR